jgi:hypothetical protein
MERTTQLSRVSDVRKVAADGRVYILRKRRPSNRALNGNNAPEAKAKEVSRG